MKTYKFRAERHDNGEYIYGDLVTYYEPDGSKYYQIRRFDDDDDSYGYYNIKAQTIRQLVGTIGGIEMYEGDPYIDEHGNSKRAVSIGQSFKGCKIRGGEL